MRLANKKQDINNKAHLLYMQRLRGLNVIKTYYDFIKLLENILTENINKTTVYGLTMNKSEKIPLSHRVHIEYWTYNLIKKIHKEKNIGRIAGGNVAQL